METNSLLLDLSNNDMTPRRLVNLITFAAAGAMMFTAYVLWERKLISMTTELIVIGGTILVMAGTIVVQGIADYGSRSEKPEARGFDVIQKEDE